MKQVKLTIGTKTKKQLRETVKHTDWSRDILSEVKISTKKKVIDLEIYTGQELGFVGIATRKEIFDKGLSLGLELCPAEVAYYLREPEGAFLAMEPIMDQGMYPRILQSASDRIDDEYCLVYGPSGYPELVWGDTYRWVFVRPQENA